LLHESNVEKYFWAEAINTSCYILNRVSIRNFLTKHLMNFEKIENQTFHIFIFLVVFVIF
jgi:hypothetical protein